MESAENLQKTAASKKYLSINILMFFSLTG